MRGINKFVILTLLSLGLIPVFAAPVTKDQAKTAVGNWMRMRGSLDSKINGKVKEARTCSADGAEFHVVKLENGGYVITSGDTRIEPIIAFSSGEDLEEDDNNPLWALIKGDLVTRTAALAPQNANVLMSVSSGTSAAENKWRKYLPDESTMKLMSTPSMTSISDVRVAPLVQSKWTQTKNSMYSNRGENCFNYYTPKNYACGCVATALAQIMRYHQFPTSISSVTKTCKVDNVSSNCTTISGTLNYSAMPLIPEAATSLAWYAGGATEAQRQEIGKLTYNCGVAMCMHWHSKDGAVEESAGTSYGGFSYDPLLNVFHFASAKTYLAGAGKDMDEAIRKNIALSNIDAGFPVILGLRGHEVIADGYGYSDSILYTHLNMGWADTDDVWYALPDVQASGYSSTYVDHVVYNIFPMSTGDVLSGRVTDPSGIEMVGAAVTVKNSSDVIVATTNTNEKGIYAFILPGGNTYSVEASYLGSSNSKSVTLKASVNPTSVDLSTGSYSSGSMTWGGSWGNDIQLAGVDSVASPVFSPAGCGFDTTLSVTISCATDGAAIYYTTDGSEPDESCMRYTGPISVIDTTTIKARAYKAGMSRSALIEASYTYTATTLAAALDTPGLEWTTSTDYPWTYETTNTYDNTDAAQSAVMANYYTGNTSWMKTSISGPATVVFKYKTRFPNGTFGAYVDGAAAWTISAGANLNGGKWYIDDNWYDSEIVLVPAGVHEFKIMYTVSGYFGGFTGAWVDQVVITYSKTATDTTDVPVPYSWIDAYYSGAHSASDYETIGHQRGQNGYTVWQAYVAGLNPTDANADIKSTIRMVGNVPVVEWNVTNVNAEAMGYHYKIKGKQYLTTGEWTYPTNSNHRFFKVFLEK